MVRSVQFHYWGWYFHFHVMQRNCFFRWKYIDRRSNVDNKQIKTYMPGQQDLSARSADKLDCFWCASVFQVMKNQGFFIAAVSHHSEDIWIGKMCHRDRKKNCWTKKRGKNPKKRTRRTNRKPKQKKQQEEQKTVWWNPANSIPFPQAAMKCNMHHLIYFLLFSPTYDTL